MFRYLLRRARSLFVIPSALLIVAGLTFTGVQVATADDTPSAQPYSNPAGSVELICAIATVRVTASNQPVDGNTQDLQPAHFTVVFTPDGGVAQVIDQFDLPDGDGSFDKTVNYVIGNQIPGNTDGVISLESKMLDPTVTPNLSTCRGTTGPPPVIPPIEQGHTGHVKHHHSVKGPAVVAAGA